MEMQLYLVDHNAIKAVTGHQHTAIKYHADKSSLYAFIMEQIRNLLNLSQHETIELKYTATGKKYFQYKDDIIFFSISYSANDCVFVLSFSGEVGIDMEVLREKRAGFYQNVIRQSFSEQEQQICRRSTVDFFWETWTVKEAVVKYMGCGLAFDLKTIIHTGQNVCWPGAGQALSLIKIRLGKRIISLITESGCDFNFCDWSDVSQSHGHQNRDCHDRKQTARRIHATVLPVLRAECDLF